MNINIVTITGVILPLILFSPSVFAAVITVSHNGTGDFPSINAAINHASAGDQIRVIDQGTYTENLLIGDIVLTSEPVGSTLKISNGGGVVMNSITSSTLRGFNVVNDGSGGIRAIVATGSGIVNIENIDLDGQGKIDQGIFSDRAITLNVKNSTIHDMEYQGIIVEGDNANGCILNVNSCQIYNTADVGMRLANQVTMTMSDTVLHDVGWHGILLANQAGPHTVLSLNNCEIRNFKLHGFYIANQSGKGVIATLNGCNIHGSTGGIGVVQEQNSTLYLNDCRIHENAFDGVLISEFGPAIDASVGYNLTINNSILQNNGRDGILIQKTPHLTVRKTKIINSHDVGIFIPTSKDNGGTLILEESEIRNSGLWSLAVYALDQWMAMNISRNIFIHPNLNELNVTLASATLGSRFVNNLIDGGGFGLFLLPTNLNVYHNTIVNIRKNGIEGHGNSIDITNAASLPVDVRNNVVDQVDYAILAEDIPGTLGKVVVDYNLAHGIINLWYALEPLAGPHNILGVPAGFISPSTTVGAGDYHLAAGSVVIDAGDPSLGINVDLEGRIRPQGKTPDMGAFEYGARKNGTDHWELYL